MGTSIRKVLPVDLYHTVSMPELILERALKIIHISGGKGEDLPKFERGTLIVLCSNGFFSCNVNEGEYEVAKDQVMLAASESITKIKSLIETEFDGVIIYVTETFLVNRQRLLIRNVTPSEKEDANTYLHLIEKQIENPREIRSKIIESLLRALIISLQYEPHIEKTDSDSVDIPPMLCELAALINRYHHAPAYFYAEKLGLSSPEFNTRCRQYSQMTAVEWISDYVLLEAKDLLRKTRLRMTQIAELLGFANQDTFSRWFRRQTGEFPSEWNR